MTEPATRAICTAMTDRPAEVARDPASIDLDFARGALPAGLVAYSRASSKWFGRSGDGLQVNLAANRFHADHDEFGRTLGYSSEEQRTNLLHDTESFQSGWTKSSPGVTLISASEIAPDGQPDAECWEFDQTAGTRQIRQTGVACAASAEYRLSLWLKAGNANAPTVLRSRVSGDSSGTIIGGVAYARLDGTALNPRAETGWVRGVVPFTTGPGDTTLTVNAVEVQTDGGSNSDAQLVLWGAMLEAGTFPSSYIANSAASGTATRAADALTVPLAGRFGSNQDGTFLVEWRMPPGLKPGGQSYSLMAGSLDNAEQIGIDVNHNNADSFDFTWRIGGVWKNTLRPAGAAAPLADYRSAIAWARDGSRTAFNNGISASTASADGVPAVEELRVGFLAASSSWTNGWIRRVRYWPRRLGDGELAELTG